MTKSANSPRLHALRHSSTETKKPSRALSDDAPDRMRSLGTAGAMADDVVGCSAGGEVEWPAENGEPKSWRWVPRC